MKPENFLEHTKKSWKMKNLKIALTIVLMALVIAFISREAIIKVVSTPEFKTYDELLVASTLNTKGLFQTSLSYDDMYYFETAFIDENDNVERYYAALINEDGNFTLAEIPAALAEDENTSNLIGSFEEMPSDLYGYITEELVDLGVTETEAAEMMPLNLYSVKDNEVEGYVFIGISGILLLGSLFFFFRMIQAGSGSLITKKLSKFGEVDRYMLDLERTPVSSEHPNLAISGTNYILLTDKNVEFIPIRNVIWAYEYVKKKKAYMVVTVSKQHHLVLVDHNKKHFAPMKMDEVNQALHFINKTTPGAVIGYTKEIDKMYSNSREAFINSVSTQKQSINVDEGFDFEGKY